MLNMTDVNRIRCDHVFKQGQRKGAICGDPIYRGVSDSKCHRHVPKSAKNNKPSEPKQEQDENEPASVENIAMPEPPPEPVEQKTVALAPNEEEPILPDFNPIEDFHKVEVKTKTAVKPSAKKAAAAKRGKKKRTALEFSNIGKVFFVAAAGLAEDLSKSITTKFDGFQAAVAHDDDIMACVDEIVEDLTQSYLGGEVTDPYTKLGILMLAKLMFVYSMNKNKSNASEEEIARMKAQIAEEAAKLNMQREQQEQIRAELEHRIDEQIALQQQQQSQPQHRVSFGSLSIGHVASVVPPGIVVEGEDAPKPITRTVREEEPIDLALYYQ